MNYKNIVAGQVAVSNGTTPIIEVRHAELERLARKGCGVVTSYRRHVSRFIN